MKKYELGFAAIFILFFLSSTAIAGQIPLYGMYYSFMGERSGGGYNTHDFYSHNNFDSGPYTGDTIIPDDWGHPAGYDTGGEVSWDENYVGASAGGAITTDNSGGDPFYPFFGFYSSAVHGISRSFTGATDFIFSSDYIFNIQQAMDDDLQNNSYGQLETILKDETEQSVVSSHGLISQNSSSGTFSVNFRNLNPEHSYSYTIKANAFSTIITDQIYTDSSLEWESFVSANVTIHDASAVPEPTTIFLLGSGLIGLVGIRRKVRNS